MSSFAIVCACSRTKRSGLSKRLRRLAKRQESYKTFRTRTITRLCSAVVRSKHVRLRMKPIAKLLVGAGKEKSKSSTSETKISGIRRWQLSRRCADKRSR